MIQHKTNTSSIDKATSLLGSLAHRHYAPAGFRGCRAPTPCTMMPRCSSVHGEDSRTCRARGRAEIKAQKFWGNAEKGLHWLEKDLFRHLMTVSMEGMSSDSAMNLKQQNSAPAQGHSLGSSAALQHSPTAPCRPTSHIHRERKQGKERDFQQNFCNMSNKDFGYLMCLFRNNTPMLLAH